MTLESAIHYYYSGGNLIQEFDEMYEDSTVADDLTWDYLRGLGGQVVRRRKRNGEDDYTDMLHFNDMMGTAREEVNPKEVGSEVEGSAYGYVTTADGEPLSLGPVANLEENHIQFHGGFLEDRDFHESFDRGYFYRMGIRHYSPDLGRFLQRDPFSYSRAPHKSNPISLNPYEYGLNRPTQLSDRSGYQACPGCASPFGGAAPIGMLPSGGGFGTDTGGPGGDTGGGPDLPDTPENRCLRPYPAECKQEGIPDYCYPCCQWKSDPSWRSNCCDAASIPYHIPECAKIEPFEPNDPCSCACCWAGGEENAPTPIGGGGFGGGSSGSMGPIFGPPSIGPWGDGGEPWDIRPRPLSEIFPWCPEYNGLMIWNSFKNNLTVKSNINGTLSPMIAWFVIGGVLAGAYLLAMPLFCYYHGCGPLNNPYKNILYPPTSGEICNFWENCICICCNAYWTVMLTATVLAFIVGIYVPPAILGIYLIATTIGIYACIMEYHDCIEFLSEAKILRAKMRY